MGEPYIGEIRIFAGNFAPAGWALCQGQLMPISQNDTLFTLIGTMYGGDGQSTFGLPDLQGRFPTHFGQSPGVTQTYQQAEQFGVESVTITTNSMPQHNHAFLASTDLALATDPTGNVVAQPVSLNLFFGDVPGSAMNNQAVTLTGGSQPHENMSPFLVLNFIISLFGVYPTQT